MFITLKNLRLRKIAVMVLTLVLVIFGIQLNGEFIKKAEATHSGNWSTQLGATALYSLTPGTEIDGNTFNFFSAIRDNNEVTWWRGRNFGGRSDSDWMAIISFGTAQHPITKVEAVIQDVGGTTDWTIDVRIGPGSSGLWTNIAGGITCCSQATVGVNGYWANVSGLRIRMVGHSDSIFWGGGTLVRELRAFGPFPHTLIVTNTGSNGGGGMINWSALTSSGSCATGNICTPTIQGGYTVTLTATPNGISNFGGWSDACASFGTNPTCTITLNDDTFVTGTFTIQQRTLTVSKSGPSPGDVAVIDDQGFINCGATCNANYDYGTAVTLTAAPANIYTQFDSWTGGGCTGSTSTVCVVTMNTNQNVTANFSLIPQTLFVIPTGSGSGVITSNPAGINCGGVNTDCSFNFNFGANVTLTATPDVNSKFTQWTGDCTGTTPTCTLTMNNFHNASAEFTSAITNTANPDLSGWAWSSQVGWLSFNCIDRGVCGQSDYRVEIDPFTGLLNGWAWNEKIGWVQFDALPDLITGNYPANPQTSAMMDINTGVFSGWARVLAYENQASQVRSNGPAFAVAPVNIRPSQGPKGLMMANISRPNLQARLGDIDFDFLNRVAGHAVSFFHDVFNKINVVKAAHFVNWSLELGSFADITTAGNFNIFSQPVGGDPNLIRDNDVNTFNGGFCSGICSFSYTTTINFPQIATIQNAEIVHRGTITAFSTGNSINWAVDLNISGTWQQIMSGGDINSFDRTNSQSGPWFNVSGIRARINANEPNPWVCGRFCVSSIIHAIRELRAFGPGNHNLTVIPGGAGSGTITSSPAGINCGVDCFEDYPGGTSVTLTATPDPQNYFTGWAGCDSVTGNTCTVTITADRNVDANFEPFPVLTVIPAGTGTGSITSSPAGIACPGTCNAIFPPNTNITLTAAPDVGSTFTDWAGDCVGIALTCTFTITADSNVVANFDLPGGPPLGIGDGWIRMENATRTKDKLTGWAWGGEPIGWLNFWDVHMPSPTCAFAADKKTVNPSESVTLSWNCDLGNTTCDINEGIGPVDPISGSVVHKPDKKVTVYELTCNGLGTTKKWNVEVKIFTPPRREVRPR